MKYLAKYFINKCNFLFFLHLFSLPYLVVIWESKKKILDIVEVIVSLGNSFLDLYAFILIFKNARIPSLF
jgi:hypothetical protein